MKLRFCVLQCSVYVYVLERQMTTHSSMLAWKNAMDRGVWQATVHKVTESDTSEAI